MTNLSPQTSTLAGAVRIVRMHGLARQVPLVLGMMLAGVLEGVGIASIFPILSIVTQGQGAPTRLNETIARVAARHSAKVYDLAAFLRTVARDGITAGARRERVVWDLVETLTAFVVQREACGLRDARHVFDFYGVPR